MPSVKPQFNKRSFQRLVRKAIGDHLSELGFARSEISTESIPNIDVIRVSVINPDFKDMSQMERQDLVWRILKESFSDDQEKTLHISMVLTLTPAEAEGKWD